MKEIFTIQFYLFLTLLLSSNIIAQKENNSHLFIGVSNNFFTDKVDNLEENLYSFGPFIGYRKSNFDIKLGIEPYKFSHFIDMTQIIDGTPFFILNEYKISHIPISFNYHFTNDKTISPVIGINTTLRKQKIESTRYYATQDNLYFEIKDTYWLLGLHGGVSAKLNSNCFVNLLAFYKSSIEDDIKNFGLTLSINYSL